MRPPRTADSGMITLRVPPGDADGRGEPARDQQLLDKPCSAHAARPLSVAELASITHRLEFIGEVQYNRPDSPGRRCL
jgi:hypothetical protein